MPSSKRQKTRGYRKGPKGALALSNLLSASAAFTTIFIFLFPLLYNPFGRDMFDGIKLAAVFVFLPLIFLERIFLGKIETLRISKAVLFLSGSALWASFASLFSVLYREAFLGEYLRRTGALLFLLVALIYMAFETRKDKEELRTVALISASVVSIIGILQRAGLIFFGNAFDGRVFSTLGNPVFLGSFLLITFPLAIGLVRENRWKGWASSLLLVSGVALSGSRAALVGLAVLALIVAVLSDKKVRNFIIVLVLVAGFVFGVFYSSRLVNLSSDIRDRVELIKPALMGIFERPLFGHGLNRYEPYFRQSPYSNWSFVAGKSEVPDTSHSFFIDATFSSGLPFLILLVLFFSSFFSKKAGLEQMLAGASVVLAFMFSPASMPVIVWAFLTLALSSEPNGIKIKVSKWVKAGSGVVLLIALVTGLVSSYRMIASDFYYQKAIGESTVGNLDSSAGFLRNAITLQPYEKTYWREYVTILLNRESTDWIQRAEVEAKKLVEIDPYDFSNQYLLGTVYLALGDSGTQGAYEKALDAFRACIYLSPKSPEVYYQAGLAAAGTKNLDQAAVYLKKAVTLFEGYTDALYALGYAYESQGKEKEALEFYQKALQHADVSEKPTIEQAIKRIRKK